MRSEIDFLNKMGYEKIYKNFNQFNQDVFYIHNSRDTIPQLSHSIKELHCEQIQLKSLPDVLPSNLIKLDCDHNNLTSLPPLPNNLFVLRCNYNTLTTLPSLPNQLKILKCNSNKIEKLPDFPPNLKYLSCKYNKLTTLPPPTNTLSIIECEGNLFPEGYIEEYNKEHPHLSIII